jgi:hypothetical protein
MKRSILILVLSVLSVFAIESHMKTHQTGTRHRGRMTETEMMVRTANQMLVKLLILMYLKTKSPI